MHSLGNGVLSPPPHHHRDRICLLVIISISHNRTQSPGKTQSLISTSHCLSTDQVSHREMSTSGADCTTTQQTRKLTSTDTDHSAGSHLLYTRLDSCISASHLKMQPGCAGWASLIGFRNFTDYKRTFSQYL